MRLSRIASLTGILLLVLVIAGCGSTSSSTPSSPGESAAVGNRAESFTKDFLEAKVSDISSYFAESVELITMHDDGTKSTETATKAEVQTMYANDYKAQVDAVRVAVPTLSMSATLSNKTISISSSTSTVAGDIKVTATIGSTSQSLEIPGCSLTFTKAGDNWVITKWARPDAHMDTFLTGLTG